MTLAEEIRYWLDSINESGFDDAFDELDRETDAVKMLDCAKAFKAAKYPDWEKYSDEALAQNETFISYINELEEKSGEDPLILLMSWAKRNPAYQEKAKQDKKNVEKVWNEEFFNFMTKLTNKEKQGIKALPGDTAKDDRLRIYTYRGKKYRGRNAAYAAMNDYVEANASSLFKQSKGKL